MHFLGVAGMPRRIPGERLVLVLRVNDYSKNLAKTDNLNLKLYFFLILLFFSRPGKFDPSKSKFFGQCTKIGFEVLYTCFFAIMLAGSHNGTVGPLVNIKQHVSLCPKRDRFLFKTVDVFSSSYITIIKRTNRAFNKLGNFIRKNTKFYSNSNYDKLTKHECGNHFGTVEF